MTEKHFTLPSPRRDDRAFLNLCPRSARSSDRGCLTVIRAAGGPRACSANCARDERMCAFVESFHARGGVVIAGSDEMPPGPALVDEIVLLTDRGFTPLAALQAATQQAGSALRRPEIGTLLPGNLADMVLLDDDPLSNPANLRKVWRVIKGGHVHDPAVLLAPFVSEYDTQWWHTWRTRGLGASLLLFPVSQPLLRERRRRAL